MERESFPTLTEGATGWPVLTTFWSLGRLEIEVCEDNDVGSMAVIQIRAGRVPFLIHIANCTADSGHDWRRVADNVIYRETRNGARGPEHWELHRLVDVCSHCGNPETHDEWHPDV